MWKHPEHWKGRCEVGMLGLGGGVDNRSLFFSNWKGAAESVHFKSTAGKPFFLCVVLVTFLFLQSSFVSLLSLLN